MKVKNCFKKSAAVILACLIAAMATACKTSASSGKKPTDSDLSNSFDTDLINKKDRFSETQYKLVSNKRSEYSIVYPKSQETDGKMMLAVAELQSLFLDSTGIALKAYSDDVLTSANKIISLGKTAQFQSNETIVNRVKDEKLGSQGYILKTYGSSVYLVGNSTIADVYAVYEFLEWQFDYEAYARDCYKINKNVSNINLLDFDLVDIPDFEARTPNNFEGMVTRLRGQSYTTGFNAVDGSEFCHNMNALIPGSKYYSEHPKWFAKYVQDGHTGQELCLNAHGDTTERAKLVEAVFNEMTSRLLKDPSIDWISFCQEDTATVCDCTACTKDYALYDRTQHTANYATYIRFINEVARKIKSWNAEVCPERNIIIFLWDYGKVKYAPVKLDEKMKPVTDENGNYLPYSDDLILEDNVAVYFCAFTMANFVGIDNQFNAADLDALKRIQAIMKNPLMYFWIYTTCFADYLMPYDSIETKQEYYKFIKDQGAIGIFDQAQFDNNSAADFGALKSYVSSKLMWNVNEDVDYLIKDFFANYYQDAGEIMNELYDEYRSYFDYLIDEKGMVGGIASMTGYKNQEIWPYSRLKRFQSYIEKAYDAIAKYRYSNFELYETLRIRILKESLTFRYLELSLYPEFYDTETLNKLQTQLRKDCVAAGLTNAAENTSIETLFAY